MSVTEAPTRPAAAPQACGAGEKCGDCCGNSALLLIALGSVLWLGLALLLELVTSVKLHMPALLSGHAMFTYGRLHAASETALLYGFAVPAALATGLWLLTRIGKAAVAGPIVVMIAAATWFLAVAAGIWGILRGANTGYPTLEMPGNLHPILLAAFLVIGVCAVLTFHNRQPAPLYPSQWFVIGSLFWFAWIFATAAGLLLHDPVRGVLQASVDWWYQHNFQTVFLGFAGLAATFYFIPKLTGQRLHSRYMAALAFWMIALVGSWGGIPEGSPFPSWIIGMSVVGTVFTLVPILAVGLNMHGTVRNSFAVLESDPYLRFFCAAQFCWIISGVQDVVGSLPSVSTITNFTWFAQAQHELFRYGFFGLAMFGAFYYFIPRLAEPNAESPDDLWCPRLRGIHFWCSLIGVFVAYLSMLCAGIWQGVMLNDPSNTFVSVMRSSMIPLRFSALGTVLLLAGTAAFILNFAQLLKGMCARCCGKAKGAA